MEQTPQAIPNAEPVPEKPSVPSTGGASRVLIMDDEDSLARALARLLRRDGYVVETVSDGRLGLDRLRTRDYEVILCDLRMPELDGRGVYRALERCAPHLCQRLIFLTGDTLDPETNAFLAQTGRPHLTKPFQAAEFRQTMRRFLQQTLE